MLGSVSGTDFIQFFEEQWKPLFGGTLLPLGWIRQELFGVNKLTNTRRNTRS